ncbi:MOSC domain-containing protein [Paractinoplanes ferrugineus]|uniref:Molybdenum cofactor biosysynthesis protein n=1 Tax=Paractinoplanes ferrugineus TaxID=113564 RepID=A0A919J303_9ACTN|nr:MOSC N-terminal beta barrel domain-containing protein [Actinoplanes ferrugineus]GIE09636.1 molybdenum cofactor biosysynthesis protein [Actinoplanes ferrugineus]
MRITAVATYPVKGCHRIEHEVAEVEPWGLTGDRRWMIVDPEGVGITQRDSPLLTQLSVRMVPGGLELSAPDMPTLVVDEPVDGPKDFVRVFKRHAATPARIAESAWSSAFLGRPVRLVWQADAGARTVGGAPGDGEPVSFADGYPLLLANEASLSSLNDWLVEAGEEAVPMTRFRPNLVVAGAEAWIEDDWSDRGVRLAVGSTVLRADTPCPRCLVITIDQENGEKGKQPLRMLGQRRRFGGRLLFAINLVPVVTGSLRVGDSVTVLH